MKITVPAEIEVVGLSDWSYYRGMSRRTITIIHWEVSWGDGFGELIVRFAGFGVRVTACARADGGR